MKEKIKKYNRKLACYLNSLFTNKTFFYVKINLTGEFRLTLKHNSSLGKKTPELSKLKTNFTSTKPIINPA